MLVCWRHGAREPRQDLPGSQSSQIGIFVAESILGANFFNSVDQRDLLLGNKLVLACGSVILEIEVLRVGEIFSWSSS